MTLTDNPSAEEIVRLIEEHGRNGREFLFDLVLPDKIARLCDALSTAKSARVRAVICNLLASLADPAALPCLLERLDDEAPDVVAAAADAIGNCAWEQELSEDLRMRLGTALLNLASNPNRPLKTRTGSIYGLGLMRHAPALPQLLKSLESEVPLERSASAEALAHLGDQRAINALRKQLVGESDDRVKRYLRLALESIAPEDGAAP